MFAYANQEQKQTAKSIVQKKEPEKVVTTSNRTGISDVMKTRFENLSGFSFDDVRVHYNSDKPAQLQALAYTQGNQVYVAPGQEKHLGHELGHVVQQKEKKVKPTGIINGAPINDNTALEQGADILAANVTQLKSKLDANKSAPAAVNVIQRQASECTRALGVDGGLIGAQLPPATVAYPNLPQNPGAIHHNLNFEHRHIIFDQPQPALPDHLGAAIDNIGFHCETGGIHGPGQLFSELDLAAYTRRRVISITPADDANLVAAINLVGVNGRFARYNLLTNNCQDWVDNVIADYNTRVAAPPIGQRGILARIFG